MATVEFEERADQLTLETIDATLSDGQIFRSARKKLLATGAKLLVGPRGTGKTHLMRYTYIQAMRDKALPLALYANFSRYLNLEPLLRKSPDAIQRFHSWVIAKIILSVFDLVHDKKESVDFLISKNQLLDEVKLRRLVALLERSSGAEEYEQIGQHLTVQLALEAIKAVKDHFGRARVVLLLDDAALSLTDQYLISFFEIYRLLKTDTVSPKASVYPGSTQYGPTFHASHEAELISLWLSVEDDAYLEIMGDIAERRFTNGALDVVNADTLDLLKYMAFGSPRAYLRLVRAYLNNSGTTSQSKINRVVEEHSELIGAEYDSLGIKLKQFSSVISTGRKFFDRVVSDFASTHGSEVGRRNIVLGLNQGPDRTPLADRMLRFLVEIGMLYPLQAVSHGANRRYDRFIPHLSFLYKQGVFRSGRGSSPKDVAIYMQLPSAKHPLRRELSTILLPQDLARLKLDLPPCQNCGTPRLNESQRFCHNCGAELVGSSLFEECMKLPLNRVPGISVALVRRIHQDTNIRIVGDVYASQNASADLQQASYVGPVRAQTVVSKVTLTVNEFLS